ncbi:norsolorinic acid reductase [Aspergillus udagawae]|nr:norsolorinic acid reductase [Aspergillus udagawae]
MSLPTGAAPPSPLGYHRVLGPNASIKVSPICLGTMNFGTAWEELMGKCDKATAFAVLDYFYENGGNFIDTASNYQFEETEKWIGEWMQQLGNRDEMVVATKFSSGYQFHKPGYSIQSNYGGNNKKSMRLSLAASLEKLQTHYVDIFYVHYWEGTASIPELMRGLDDLVRCGKVLYLGASDMPAWVVVKCNEYSRQHGLSQFVVYEGRWNAVERDMEREILPMCKAEGMALTIWGSLGGGKFKSAAQRGESGGRHGAMDVGIRSEEIYRKVSAALETIATRRDTVITAVAMQYIRQKAPYIFPICGGRKIEHLKGNIEALRLELSEEDIALIDEASEFELGFPHSFLSGSSQKQVSASSPCAFINMFCNFEGVPETKAIAVRHPKAVKM